MDEFDMECVDLANARARSWLAKRITELETTVGTLGAQVTLLHEMLRQWCGPRHYGYMRTAAEDALDKPEPYEYESGGGIAGARP